MHRTLTSRSSLDNLKREAKRWQQALLAHDVAAYDRLRRAVPHVPAQITLRDVQHALAREFGFAGWTDLKTALLSGTLENTPRAVAVRALLEAADSGNAERIAELLDAMPDIVSERGLLPGHSGLRTALHLAVGQERENIVALLLTRGADPNVRDEGDNAVPLHFAAEKENLPIIRRLVEAGSETIGAGDDHELEIIGWATVFGTARRDVADYLLAHGARHNICSAVALGDVGAIRANAADVERVMDRANLRRRPLHLAVVKKRADSLAALLALGATTEHTDAGGLTALDQAALDGESDMVQLLLDAGAQLHLPAAIALGRREDIERLLAAEPDALKPGGRWGTLIVKAAERGSHRVIEMLVKAGASPNAADDTKTSVDSTTGYTALHAAAFNNNARAASTLMQHGANVRARDTKYCGTPAGWANHRGHAELRDYINTGNIDLFDAMAFGLEHRIPEIIRANPGDVDRRFAEYRNGSTNDWINPSFTPLMWAVVQGKTEAIRQLVENGADTSLRDASGRSLHDLAPANLRDEILALVGRALAGPDAHEKRVASFLERACLDWRSGASARVRSMHDAGRLLRNDPDIARDGIHTAVVCGDIEHVEQLLRERPQRAVESGGPRGWPPLLYLCDARLPIAAAADNAVAIARLLLDHGADPDCFYFGGNAAIHYTALTCVMGRGEEQALMHPAARELADLLLDRGAALYDMQVLYNVFADHASRKDLTDDIVWFMDLMYTHAVRRGRSADWSDPDWSMLDMGGYRPGARYLLGAAVDNNLLVLAEWMLAHGASPNSAPSDNPALSQLSMYERATKRSAPEMAALLLRFGAERSIGTVDAHDAFVDAVLRGDEASVRAIIARHPEYLADHRALFHAVQLNRAAAVKLLLAVGVSPDVADPANRSRALHGAAYAGAVDAARVLIDHGAEIDPRENDYHAVPLGVASWARQQPMIDLLGRYSRDVWELVFTGRVERLRELLSETPALATTTNAEGSTPLMWLPTDEASALAIVKLFLDLGANPSALDPKGRTARDIAVERGMTQVAALLAQRDPDRADAQ
jgi:ankyrin repeat protein